MFSSWILLIDESISNKDSTDLKSSNDLLFPIFSSKYCCPGISSLVKSLLPSVSFRIHDSVNFSGNVKKLNLKYILLGTHWPNGNAIGGLKATNLIVKSDACKGFFFSISSSGSS